MGDGWDIVKDAVTGKSGKAAGKFYHKVGKDLGNPLKSPAPPGQLAATPEIKPRKKPVLDISNAMGWEGRMQSKYGSKGYK